MPQRVYTAEEKEATRKAREWRKSKSKQFKRLQENDIGEILEPRDWDIRRQAEESLQFFMTEFFGEEIFSDPFGEVQTDSIAHEQQVFQHGGRPILKLEPRGYGKSTRSLIAAVWGALNGYSDFTLISCDSVEKSQDLLKLAESAASDYEYLREIYPELVAFHMLQGNYLKANFQTYNAEKTGISIKRDTLVFPKIPDVPWVKSSEAIIAARPYRKLRGKNIKARRPKVIILDDVQTTEDAISPTATEKNLRILQTDVSMLGSRKKKVSIINNATVIDEQDFPSRLSEMNAFTTIRYKMVTSMPDESSEPLWDKYRAIRNEYDEDRPGDDERAQLDATEFYRQNRAEMDKGSGVTWDYAFDPDIQLSTIQAAIDFIDDYGIDAFNSECQNEPRKKQADPEFLDAHQIARKQHPHRRAILPGDVSKITAFIDVQQTMLYYTVMAFSDGFNGYVIEKGTYPEQPQNYFIRRKAKKRLSNIYQTTTLEGRIKQALLDLSNTMLNVEYKRIDDVLMPIDVLGMDSRYKTDTVRSSYNDSAHKGRIQLCMGYGYTAKKKPMAMRSVKISQGEQKGHGWFLGAQRANVQTLEYDANIWKSFIHQRFATALHDPASFSVYQVDEPALHSLYADHLKAEYRTKLEGPWGEVDEWAKMPGNPDNDFLDTTVGCAVLASFKGVKMTGTEYREERKKIKSKRWSKFKKRG